METINQITIYLLPALIVAIILVAASRLFFSDSSKVQDTKSNESTYRFKSHFNTTFRTNVFDKSAEMIAILLWVILAYFTIESYFSKDIDTKFVLFIIVSPLPFLVIIKSLINK
ncbi:hypothetical protein HBN50_16440 [Halobacteriovorax sp. GB3]|uniref:hypothetical protein n=1 Tax=Halobacteriovorax sp. GB3 TaxID=2719615 RepID=UPI002362C570|nr:hypothetical protein [Halobacteriovorax sp. GB3]MDD0854699.1 hypothetical protein [Halobacteriovorax sp. GB3]